MDRLRALELAGRLAMAYPARNVTEEHAGRWADLLEPLEDDAARTVVTMLANRSTDPPSAAQVRQAIAEAQQETMSEWSTWDCVFMDGVVCPNCSRWGEQIVHGHLLTPAELASKIADLRGIGAS